MKKALASITITLVIILGIASTSGVTLLNHRNIAVGLEERIEAQYVANKSNYDSMWKQTMEMTQVTELQASQFKDVYTDLITGRNQDQELLFKVIHEQNPQLDTSIYTELTRNISDNRKTFDNNQKAITDVIREYNTYIKQHFIMSSITGRIVKDANSYITTSEQTTQAFDTKKADAINITGN